MHTARAFGALVLAAILASCGSASTLGQTLAPATSAPAGAITGRLAFGSEYMPALTVYAISVSDPRAFFSVNTPRYPPAASGPDGMRYTIGGVAPGVYNVLAYRNSDRTANDGPFLYSQYVVRCVQPSERTPYPTGPCSSLDHTLVPVTVQVGQTVTGVDVTDQFPQLARGYPARPNSTPMGFVLPATCSYAGSPVVGSDSSQWRFDCGVVANRDARGALASAFERQGWSSCGAGLGNVTWKNADLRLSVSEGSGVTAPDGLPTLTQMGSTVSTACG